jgi:hypothetical protein
MVPFAETSRWQSHSPAVNTPAKSKPLKRQPAVALCD